MAPHTRRPSTSTSHHGPDHDRRPDPVPVAVMIRWVLGWVLVLVSAILLAVVLVSVAMSEWAAGHHIEVLAGISCVLAMPGILMISDTL